MNRMIDKENETKLSCLDNLALTFQAGLSIKPVREIIREGVQEILRLALEAEVSDFILCLDDKVNPDGLKRIVRNGYHRERVVQCGVGAITLSVPRTRDRGKAKEDNIIFQSRIIPRYLRKVHELDSLIPFLYFKALLNGDFSEVFSLLLGEEDTFSGPAAVTLKREWDEDYRYYMFGAEGSRNRGVSTGIPSFGPHDGTGFYHFFNDDGPGPNTTSMAGLTGLGVEGVSFSSIFVDNISAGRWRYTGSSHLTDCPRQGPVGSIDSIGTVFTVPATLPGRFRLNEQAKEKNPCSSEACG
ncbi:MAG: hypothetical protein GY940_27660 [bacterium]|nr:hypothetical protein [bacterium]